MQLRQGGYHLTAESLEAWWNGRSLESLHELVVSNVWREILVWTAERR